LVQNSNNVHSTPRIRNISCFNVNDFAVALRIGPLGFLERGIGIIINSFQNRFDIHSRRSFGRLIHQRFANGVKDALRGLSGLCGKLIGFTEHDETFVVFAEVNWNFTKNDGRLVHTLVVVSLRLRCHPLHRHSRLQALRFYSPSAEMTAGTVCWCWYSFGTHISLLQQRQDLTLNRVLDTRVDCSAWCVNDSRS